MERIRFNFSSKRIIGLLCVMVMLASGFASAAPATLEQGPFAQFGTPVLGTDDALWETATELELTSRIFTGTPEQEGSPEATGKARVLWDEDFLYVRVDVTDEQIALGQAGAGSEHMYDGVEVYLGAGEGGSNQWRLGANGNFAGGQNAPGREGFVKMTDGGYIAELKVPGVNVALTNDSPITFDVYINNSSATGNDRYEVVSALGDPDAAYGSDESFRDSLILTGGPAIPRHAVIAAAGTNGAVAPSGLVRVADGESQTFAFTPADGYVVDSVTVNGAAVEIADNSYTLENVTTDDTVIDVTFTPDPAATQVEFIVYNDNFATGEYTTAVIIDAGEGNTVNASDLSDDMFTVIAHDTMLDGGMAFEATRKINRVYVNDAPKPLGYMGAGANSPDYQDGLASGRYIVAEIEFWTMEGGNGTLQGSNSTIQNYNIAANSDVVIGGQAITKAAFVQTDVVNELIDMFEASPAVEGLTPMEYGLYIHKDASGAPVNGLPLYIYAHGSTRGGTQPNDTFAPIRSANGAIALVKKMQTQPEFASHVIAMRATENTHATTDVVRSYVEDLVAKGLVDPDRVYASGFSMGAGFTTRLLTEQPDLLAAAMPLSSSPVDAEQAAIEGVNDLPYWILINRNDRPGENTEIFINGHMNDMTNARATVLERNEIFVWPYDQWTKEQAPINGTNWITNPHEIEASVFSSHIAAYPDTLYDDDGSDVEWSLIPVQSSAQGEWDGAYEDVFAWLFAQTR